MKQHGEKNEKENLLKMRSPMHRLREVVGGDWLVADMGVLYFTL